VNSNLTPTHLEAIVKYLHALVMSREAKLAFGAHQRQLIKDALSKKKVLDNPRTRWLISTRDRIVAVLIEEAEKYNTANPHDRISHQDMADAIATVGLKFGVK
jgi:hypothetical protein